jgi:hypothetical protein
MLPPSLLGALPRAPLVAQRWHELLGLLRLDARWFAWWQVPERGGGRDGDRGRV